MLLIVLLTTGATTASLMLSQSSRAMLQSSHVFDLSAMKQRYEENNRPQAQQEQVLTEKDADYIVNEVKRRLDYAKCASALRQSFIETGQFSDWCKECMTGEIVLPEPEFGKGSYSLMKQIVQQRLPHHDIGSGSIYDDGPRVQVQPSMFNFDLVQLQRERDAYLKERDAMAKLQEQQIVDQLVPQLQRMDDAKCFAAYVKYFEQHGNFPAYGVPECQTSVVLLPEHCKETNIRHAVNRAVKGADAWATSQGIYGFIKHDKYMKQ